MTLILTATNLGGVYQSSDYQLTDPRTGATVSDSAGSKQFQASFGGLNLMLALTGVARLSTGESTIEYLSRVLSAIPHDSNIQAICNELKQKSELAMRPFGRRGVLELVLSVGSVGNPFQVVLISNIDW